MRYINTKKIVDTVAKKLKFGAGNDKPAAKTVAKPAAKTVAKSKPAAKTVAKPAAKPVNKSTPVVKSKPGVNPVVESKPGGRPNATITDAKPVDKSTPVVKSKTGVNPVFKSKPVSTPRANDRSTRGTSLMGGLSGLAGRLARDGVSASPRPGNSDFSRSMPRSGFDPGMFNTGMPSPTPRPGGVSKPTPVGPNRPPAPDYNAPGGAPYKKGGKVRGAGIAKRGRGKGRMC